MLSGLASPVKVPQEDRCLHHWFEEMAAECPDSVAVCGRGQQLTYAELNSRANQLAHCLRARGVQRDSLVGLCLERTPEMVAGVLGILRIPKPGCTIRATALHWANPASTTAVSTAAAART